MSVSMCGVHVYIFIYVHVYRRVEARGQLEDTIHLNFLLKVPGLECAN